MRLTAAFRLGHSGGRPDDRVFGALRCQPEFVNAFDGKGVAVTVRESEQKTVALKAIPAEH